MAIIEDQELLQMFLEESREHLDGIESDFLKIEEMGEDVDSELVNNVFRAIHSVKGGAGFLGLETIKDLAHSMENVLNLIRNEELVPTPEIVGVLLSSLDLLKELVEQYETSNEADIEEHIEALHKAASGEAPAPPGESAEGPGNSAEAGSPPPEEDRDGPAPSTAQEGSAAPSPGGPVELKFPDGRRAFTVPLQDIEEAESQGKKVHAAVFDWAEDLDRKGRTPQNILAGLQLKGKVLASRVDQEEIPTLENQEGSPWVPFYVLFTAPSGESLSDLLGLPPSNIYTATAAGALLPWSPEPPVPEEPPSRGEKEAPRKEPLESKAAEAGEAPPSQPSKPKEEKTPPKKQESKGKPSPRPTRSVSPQSSTLRVHVDLLDRLMNLAGELVLTRNQLVQTFSNEDPAGLENAVQRTDLITSELQEAIMSTRMQPVGIVFHKFQRVVHDLSKSLGKQVKLVTEGEDVELDKTIIEAIGDPLTHLVRNAIDHGIEKPEVRERAGKKLPATVKLCAKHEAGQVVILVSDDGGGIDPARIRAKVLEMKLEEKEKLDALPDNEVIRFIFKPGFSTAQEVTDVSGRGVGMDVVFSNLSKLGGSVDIDSKLGQGTTVTIKLPLTLAIIPSLIVRIAGSRYAIPQVNLVELVRIPASQVCERIEKIDDAALLRLRGELLPLIRMTDVLGCKPRVENPETGEEMEDRRENLADRRSKEIGGDSCEEKIRLQERRGGRGDRRKSAESAYNIAIVNSGELNFGLVVDDLLDSEEIVVKPLGRHLRNIKTYAGATILGDGKAALILDVTGISGTLNLRAVKDRAREKEKADAVASKIQDAQSFLLVKNSPDQHFAVPLGLISRLEKIRKDQIEVTSGKKTINYRGGSLVLCSIEDVADVEPLADVDNPFVLIFPFAGKEVGVLVSEILDVVEFQDKIDEETFRQPGILGSAIIEEKTTLLLDLYGLASALLPEWVEEKEEIRQIRSEETATLLLVEDSKFFLNQVKGFTTDAGYQVRTALDGVLAMEILDDPETKIDLVLTDIEMPNMDGVELARRIRSHPRYSGVPILALTSVASEEMRNTAMEAGMNEYLIKLDRDKVLERIAHHLGRGSA